MNGPLDGFRIRDLTFQILADRDPKLVKTFDHAAWLQDSRFAKSTLHDVDKSVQAALVQVPAKSANKPNNH